MRRLSLLLVLTMVLGLFAGCQSKAEVQPTDANGLKPVTLKWYLIGTQQPDQELVMEKVNAYTKEKINATIDLKVISWGDYDKRMQVIGTSGEEYDIAFTSSWANNYLLNAQKGSYLKLNDLFDKYGKEMKAAINPAFLEGAKINGELYGIPTNKEVGQQTVLIFNKELVKKHNLDISNVKNLADLEPLLKVIKEKEPTVMPIATFDAYLPFDSILKEELPFGFNLDGETGKVVNKYEDPATMQTLKVMHEYYKKGYIKSDAATSTDSWPLEVPNWFVRKDIYQPYAEMTWGRSAKYEVAVQPLEIPHIVNNSVTGSMQGISVTSKNPERAMMFLNLLNTDPYLRNLMDKGIKDVHYTENANGQIKDLPARTERYNMPSFTLGNLFILKLYEDDPAEKWAEFEKYNQKAVKSPALGFYFDNTNVRTEIAAISNITSEYGPVLLKGVVDPEKYLPQYNRKLKEAGLQKVLDEIQKQYDAWKK